MIKLIWQPINKTTFKTTLTILEMNKGKVDTTTCPSCRGNFDKTNMKKERQFTNLGQFTIECPSCKAHLIISKS